MEAPVPHETMFDPGADTSGLVAVDPEAGPRDEKLDMASVFVVEPTPIRLGLSPGDPAVL